MGSHLPDNLNHDQNQYFELIFQKQNHKNCVQNKPISHTMEYHPAQLEEVSPSKLKARYGRTQLKRKNQKAPSRHRPSVYAVSEVGNIYATDLGHLH